MKVLNCPLLLLVLSVAPILGDSPQKTDGGNAPGSKATSCPCGLSNKGRIIGGKATLANEYPFIVEVVFLDGNVQFCGGTILTERHVITAAHCTRQAGKKQIGVIAGAHYVTKKGSARQIIKVSRHQEHANYDEKLILNDIAILFLEKPLKFNKNVGPVCMPNRNLNMENRYVKIIGWGLTSGYGEITDTLREVDVKVAPATTCRNIFHTFSPNLLFPTQICTLENGKGACMGDSGGPVVYLDPETNRYTLVGLVSYGNSFCDPKYPSVHTDVSVYVPWVEEQVKTPLCHKL